MLGICYVSMYVFVHVCVCVQVCVSSADIDMSDYVKPRNTSIQVFHTLSKPTDNINLNIIEVG